MAVEKGKVAVELNEIPLIEIIIIFGWMKVQVNVRRVLSNTYIVLLLLLLVPQSLGVVVCGTTRCLLLLGSGLVLLLNLRLGVLWGLRGSGLVLTDLRRSIRLALLIGIKR